jgi:hypothetical protein
VQLLMCFCLAAVCALLHWLWESLVSVTPAAATAAELHGKHGYAAVLNTEFYAYSPAAAAWSDIAIL